MTTTEPADRPHWAERIQAERKARGWTQSQAIDALRLHADGELPSTTPDGTIRTPRRLAEAKITFAVAAARQGNLEQAITIGNNALDIPRQSLPSLILASRDLATEPDHRHHHDEAAAPFLNRFADLLVTKE